MIIKYQNDNDKYFFLHYCKTILFLLTVSLLNTACSTVTVSHKNQAQILTKERSNIVIDSRLSSETASALLNAGLTQESCLEYFNDCLQSVSDSLFKPDERNSLAIFAELYYAQAKKLVGSEPCQIPLQRPPIDPYYTNAPLSKYEKKRQANDTKLCLANYRESLFNSIKYSYAYLFFDSLTATHAKNSLRLANDIDIQTQDIYNSASNDVISKAYQNQNNPLIYTEKKYDSIKQPSTVAAQVKTMSLISDEGRVNVYLPNEKNYLKNAGKNSHNISELISTYEVQLSGLNSNSRRNGFGIGYVALLDNRYTTNIRQFLQSNLKEKSIKRSLRKSTIKLAEKPSTQRKKYQETDDPDSRIYPIGHLLVTGIVQPQGKNLTEVLNSQDLDIHLYNPYKTNKVKILGNNYDLLGNFSASYALWLAENQLDSVGLLNLVSRSSQLSRPRLFMLEPYDPNKRVIIMLHGLASSPATWVNLTNDIFNDPQLRENYQVWQVFYATNLPILENRYQIQRLIEAAYHKTDPTGIYPASRNSVLISHSMGAVIGRMLLSNDDLTKRLDNLISIKSNFNKETMIDNKQTLDNKTDTDERQTTTDAQILDFTNTKKLNQLIKDIYNNQQLAERFSLHALPQIDTAVFISAPFRGTDYADRWFTRAMQKIIHLPLGVVQTVTSNLNSIATEGELAQNPLGALYLQNGASQLSDRSSFIQLTQDINISPKVTYHSIMANNTDKEVDRFNLLEKPTSTSQKTIGKINKKSNKNTDTSLLNVDISDGIVPYSSSHLEGASSETIINGGHSIQNNPKTILWLRKILHQQLKKTSNHDN